MSYWSLLKAMSMSNGSENVNEWWGREWQWWRELTLITHHLSNNRPLNLCQDENWKQLENVCYGIMNVFVYVYQVSEILYRYYEYIKIISVKYGYK